MRILGIDPGIGVTGYGLLEETGGGLVLMMSGEIRTLSAEPFSKRLKNLFDGLSHIIDEGQPRAVALEDTFLAKNFKSALKLGQAKGAAILAAACHHLPVFEYAPRAVKMAVAGYGGATKHQIQQMVSALLKHPHLFKSDHEADAVAIAICHLHSARFQERVSAASSHA